MQGSGKGEQLTVVAGARTHANLISLGYWDCAVKVRLSKEIFPVTQSKGSA